MAINKTAINAKLAAVSHHECSQLSFSQFPLLPGCDVISIDSNTNHSLNVPVVTMGTGAYTGIRQQSRQKSIAKRHRIYLCKGWHWFVLI
jgi:hypothetical protein